MAINIYEPLKFRSQGIEDLATRQSLTISNGKITVDNSEATESFKIVANNFTQLEGKGFSWSDGRKNKSLLFKDNSLYSDLTINLAEEQEYKINETSVLSFTELGRTVTKSNLKSVGTLRSLKVAGNADFGDFFYVSSDSNKIGINTDSPRLAVGIKENNVELTLGSSKNEYASIGTVSSSHLDIITDNTPRITIYRTGEVRVHGKLSADEINTERSSLMIFKEANGITNYGKGIMWSSERGNKQFVLHAKPDRLWTTESLDLDKEKTYMIGGNTVIYATGLGHNITESNLTKLGVLQDLQVAGDAAITRKLSTNSLDVGRFTIDENELHATNRFNIYRNQQSELELSHSITVGNSANVNRNISLYGNVSIGLAQPQENVSLTVEGAVSFDRKKFEVGIGIPTGGRYNKGDIVWNNDPKPSDYIGWVCIVEGTPGSWLPFGIISSR